MKTVFHACGQKILLEYQWTGYNNSPHYRHPDSFAEISHCPECGETLSAEVLHDEATEKAMRELFGDAL